MAIALVSNVTIPGSPTGGTSASINTTGATLIVITLSQYDASAFVAPTDNKGNTYTGLTQRTAGTGVGRDNAGARLWYCAGPIVGAGHTFTSTADYSSCNVMAFSGAATVSPVDGETGATAATTPLATNSVTPTANNAVLVTGASFGTASATITGGFTIASTVPFGASNNYANAGAYLIQTTAAAANPQWTFAGSNGGAVVIAAFKASTGLAPITGTLAVTEAADTITAVGRVAVGGTLAVTEQADTVNAAGAVRVAAALARTEANDTLTAAGTVTSPGAINGALSAFQAVQTLTATGKILVNGGLNRTQSAQTLAATGIVGSLAPPPPGQSVQVIIMS
jgi:hypothetical protein